MVSSNSSSRIQSWLLSALVVVLAVGCVASLAAAQDRYYVAPDGVKIPLIESDSELAVIFTDRAVSKIEATANRLAASGRGTLEDLKDAPDSRIKILRGANTGAQPRNRISQDPNIESVRPVFRFANIDVPIISSGELVFKVRSGLTGDEVDRLVEDYELSDVEPFDGLSGVYVAKTQGQQDEILRAETLSNDALVEWAQPNLIRPIQRRQLAIGDEFFDEQWHLQTIHAEEAWGIAEGQDILLGMFDDSCDVEHEDLQSNYTGVGHDPSVPANDAGFNDPRPKRLGDRHGTAVMGLAAAAANELGVRGVAYRSRFTPSRGLLEALSDAEVASVFTFARQQGVDVHINSWGLPGPNPSIVETAIQTAFLEGRDLDGEGGAAPLGMVVVFATGNDGAENLLGYDLSSLPWVIGVGASNSEDRRASYSNYGEFINILAPSGDDYLLTMATTDNEDDGTAADDGYNVGGLDEHSRPDLDGEGRYTKTFSGTSAACPVAAGVAALMLSANPQLSATDVRLIMEHTADQIAPSDALYNAITRRSEKYGYGRVNALKAVEAARDALDNGYTWPERVSNPRVEDSVLVFDQNIGTNEFLVVEAASDDSFVIEEGVFPEDGECYHPDQAGCGDMALATLPEDVSILLTGCEVEGEGCADGRTHRVPFEISPGERKFFGIYARDDIGRYSFGVGIDSDGNVFDAGPVLVPPSDPSDPGSVQPGQDNIAVTIGASPLAGTSPLTVSFVGNAVSDNSIDDDLTGWDFDINDGITVNTRQRHATYTYEVMPGETKTFTARLTMVDVNGNVATSTVQIFVDGGGTSSGTIGDSNVRIIVGIPGTVGSDVDAGTAPFAVELNIDVTSLAGTLQSVFWDLGDGASATSISAPHTYLNNTEQTLRYVVTATIRTEVGSAIIESTASRQITVLSSGSQVIDGGGTLPGIGADGPGGAAGCGALGVIMPLFGLMSFMWLRRRLV